MIENAALNREIYRKLFHVTGLIYPLGFAFLPRSIFIQVVLAMLTVVIAIELARLFSPSFNLKLLSRFGTLFRDEEHSRLTGVFWMLLGILWLALIVRDNRWAIAISLYVIFGDAAASLVGKGVGGPKWWRSKKTISGSLSCCAVSLMIGFFVLPQVPVHGVILGAVLATTGEVGLLPLNDNFSIPLFASLAAGIG